MSLCRAQAEFSVLALDTVPSLDVVEKGQVFPMYVWEPVAQDDGGFDLFSVTDTPEDTDDMVVDGMRRRHAVTDWALLEYWDHYNDTTITKDDLFYYVFGVLNHPDYAATYEATLRKVMPRIPRVADFWGTMRAETGVV